MLGNSANAIAIIIGSLLGVLLKNHVSEKINQTMMQALGLCVVVIGIAGSLKMQNILLVIISLALGALLGEIIDIEAGLKKFGDWIESKFKGGNADFSKAFVSATLLFCVGSMAVVGSITSGITGDNTILYAKALLDGVISFVFASTMGIGVLLSAVSVFIYQGSIVLLSGGLKPLFDNPLALGDLTAVGSVLIIGIGINILDIKQIKVGNMLPALFGPILFYGVKLLLS